MFLSLRSFMSLNLASAVWKPLVNDLVTEDDVRVSPCWTRGL